MAEMTRRRSVCQSSGRHIASEMWHPPFMSPFPLDAVPQNNNFSALDRRSFRSRSARRRRFVPAPGGSPAAPAGSRLHGHAIWARASVMGLEVADSIQSRSMRTCSDLLLVRLAAEKSVICGCGCRSCAVLRASFGVGPSGRHARQRRARRWRRKNAHVATPGMLQNPTRDGSSSCRQLRPKALEDDLIGVAGGAARSALLRTVQVNTGQRNKFRAISGGAEVRSCTR